MIVILAELNKLTMNRQILAIAQQVFIKTKILIVKLVLLDAANVQIAINTIATNVHLATYIIIYHTQTQTLNLNHIVELRHAKQVIKRKVVMIVIVENVGLINIQGLEKSVWIVITTVMAVQDLEVISALSARKTSTNHQVIALPVIEHVMDAQLEIPMVAPNATQITREIGLMITA